MSESKRRIFDYGHQEECIEITQGCSRREYPRPDATPPASTTTATIPVPRPTSGTSFQRYPDYCRSYDFKREEEIDNILNIPYKRFHQIEEEEKAEKEHGKVVNDYAPLDPRIQNGRYRRKSIEQRRKEALLSVAASAASNATDKRNVFSVPVPDRPLLARIDIEDDQEESSASERAQVNVSRNMDHSFQKQMEKTVTQSSFEALKRKRSSLADDKLLDTSHEPPRNTSEVSKARKLSSSEKISHGDPGKPRNRSFGSEDSSMVSKPASQHSGSSKKSSSVIGRINDVKSPGQAKKGRLRAILKDTFQEWKSKRPRNQLEESCSSNVSSTPSVVIQRSDRHDSGNSSRRNKRASTGDSKYTVSSTSEEQILKTNSNSNERQSTVENIQEETSYRNSTGSDRNNKRKTSQTKESATSHGKYDHSSPKICEREKNEKTYNCSSVNPNEKEPHISSARCTAINSHSYLKNLRDRLAKDREKQAEKEIESSNDREKQAEKEIESSKGRDKQTEKEIEASNDREKQAEKEMESPKFSKEKSEEKNLAEKRESKVIPATLKSPCVGEAPGNKNSSVNFATKIVSQRSVFKSKLTKPCPASHKLKLLKLHKKKSSTKVINSPMNPTSKVLTPPNSIVIEDISEDEFCHRSENPRKLNDKQLILPDVKEVVHQNENLSPVSSEGLSDGECPASSPESLDQARQDCGTENNFHDNSRIEPLKEVVTSSDLNIVNRVTALMFAEHNNAVRDDNDIAKVQKRRSEETCNSKLVDYSTRTDSSSVNNEKCQSTVNDTVQNFVGPSSVSLDIDHISKEHDNRQSNSKKEDDDIDIEDVDESALASSCILSCAAVAIPCNQPEQVDQVEKDCTRATCLDDSSSVLVSGSGLDTSKLDDRDDLVSIDIDSFLSPPSERLLSEDRGEDKTDSITASQTSEEKSINRELEKLHPSSSPENLNPVGPVSFPVLSIPESIAMSPASDSIPAAIQTSAADVNTSKGETSQIQDENSVIDVAASPQQPPLVVVADFDSVKQSVVVMAESPSEQEDPMASVDIHLRTDLYEDGHFDDSISKLFNIMASRANAISESVSSDASELTHCFKSGVTAYEKIKRFRKFKANFEKCYMYIDRMNVELQAEEVMKYDIVALCGDYEQYKVITVEEMADYYLRLLQLTILIRIAHFIKHKSNLFLLHYRITRILRYYTVAKALYQTEYTFLNIINAIDSKVSSIALIREDLMLIWDKIKAFDHYVDEVTVLREHATVGSKGFGMIVDTIVKKVIKSPITPASDPNSAPGSDDIEIVDGAYGEKYLNSNPKDSTYMAVLNCISNAFVSNENSPTQLRIEQNVQQAGSSGTMAAQEPSSQFHQRLAQQQAHSSRSKSGVEHSRKDNPASVSSGPKTRGRRKSVNARSASSGMPIQSSYDHPAFGSTPIITSVTGGCCGQNADRYSYSSQSAGISSSSQGTERFEVSEHRFEHGPPANRSGPPNVTITGPIYDPNMLIAHRGQPCQSLNPQQMLSNKAPFHPSLSQGRPYVRSELNTHSPQMVQMLAQANRNPTGNMIRQATNAVSEPMGNFSVGIPTPAPIVQLNSYSVQKYSGVNSVITTYQRNDGSVIRSVNSNVGQHLLSTPTSHTMGQIRRASPLPQQQQHRYGLPVHFDPSQTAHQNHLHSINQPPTQQNVSISGQRQAQGSTEELVILGEVAAHQAHDSGLNSSYFRAPGNCEGIYPINNAPYNNTPSNTQDYQYHLQSQQLTLNEGAEDALLNNNTVCDNVYFNENYQ